MEDMTTNTTYQEDSDTAVQQQLDTGMQYLWCGADIEDTDDAWNEHWPHCNGCAALIRLEQVFED